MIILSACDLKYEPMMRPLVRSILKNTKYEVFVKYMSPGDKSAADYCANYRPFFFQEFLTLGQDMLWLDADTIIRGDISQLEAWLKEFDTLAVHTPEMGIPGSMNHWLNSTCGIACTERGRWFINAWIAEQEKIQAAWYPSVMTEQQAYVSALEACREWIKVKDIGYEYSDKFMREESPVWEAQGARKEDAKWLAEQARYL